MGHVDPHSVTRPVRGTVQADFVTECGSTWPKMALVSHPRLATTAPAVWPSPRGTEVTQCRAALEARSQDGSFHCAFRQSGAVAHGWSACCSAAAAIHSCRVEDHEPRGRTVMSIAEGARNTMYTREGYPLYSPQVGPCLEHSPAPPSAQVDIRCPVSVGPAAGAQPSLNRPTRRLPAVPNYVLL